MNIAKIENIETANEAALETITRIRQLGAIRDELLTQLDAFFLIRDTLPHLIDDDSHPIKTQWLSKDGGLVLRVTNNHGDTESIAESLVPKIIPRPKEDRYPFITEMKGEGFTSREILDALEDGSVLKEHGISLAEAEDMHSYLVEKF